MRGLCSTRRSIAQHWCDVVTLRSQAQRWLSARKVPSGHLVTSKRYAPGESWTKEKAWWIQIPWSAVRAGKLIHIVCEVEPGSGDFRHLQVPAAFFLAHEQDLGTLQPDKINLFLAADPGIEFQDQRCPSRVSFAQFETTLT